MTAPHIVDPAGLLGQALTEASPDLMRELQQTMINALLSADADAVCGAEWNARSEQRTNHRNGYRHRPLDTRVGTVDVAVPKLRLGSYFPSGCSSAASGPSHGRGGLLPAFRAPRRERSSGGGCRAGAGRPARGHLPD
ncbi:Transposase for insertion sequence element IS1081 [Dietzia timorensis]|uniref:Mutator family transposase n=1 Tax=Dietzia timorensis TaxID=499555 RepID=A0A173LFQ7_9ACTN|nr:Transposase for insertion sequence element IS1081 [Dietzia timorensis]